MTDIFLIATPGRKSTSVVGNTSTAEITIFSRICRPPPFPLIPNRGQEWVKISGTTCRPTNMGTVSWPPISQGGISIVSTWAKPLSVTTSLSPLKLLAQIGSVHKMSNRTIVQ